MAPRYVPHCACYSLAPSLFRSVLHWFIALGYWESESWRRAVVLMQIRILSMSRLPIQSSDLLMSMRPRPGWQTELGRHMSCCFLCKMQWSTCKGAMICNVCKASLPHKHSCFDCSVLQVVPSRQFLQRHCLGLLLSCSEYLYRVRLLLLWCHCTPVSSWSATRHVCMTTFMHVQMLLISIRSANCGCGSQSFHQTAKWSIQAWLLGVASCCAVNWTLCFKDLMWGLG